MSSALRKVVIDNVYSRQLLAKFAPGRTMGGELTVRGLV